MEMERYQKTNHLKKHRDILNERYINANEDIESIKRYKDNLQKDMDVLKVSMIELIEVWKGSESEELSNLLYQHSTILSRSDQTISEFVSLRKREERHRLMLEAVAWPKFDGNVRSFPRFLSEF